jgi:Family of unknown function (DUF5985)
MQSFQATVYMLCLLTSLVCAVLLVRSYRRSRTRLLLWSALCFVALAVNNFLVFVDLVVLPSVDLLPLRHLSSLVGVSILIYGFVWEAD